MPIPDSIIKLAADLLAIRNDVYCTSSLIYPYHSLNSQFSEFYIPGEPWVSLKVPAYGPVYISDWRFVDGQGEGYEIRIDLTETDKIDALNIDWQKLEDSMREKIRENIEIRTKRMDEIRTELRHMKIGNECLKKLLLTKC